LQGKIVRREAKGPFVEGECLVIQRDFQRWKGRSKSNCSGMGVEARQPEIAGASVIVSYKENHPGNVNERMERIKVLYVQLERDPMGRGYAAGAP